MESGKSIVIGGDHAGFDYKKRIVAMLKEMGYEVKDVGTHSADSVDYPDYAHPLAAWIEEGKSSFGITLCGSGNGIAIAANKHKGIRAALCWNEELAALARQHNNANVLSIPARFITPQLAMRMVKVFLNTDFEGGRHARRVDKISL